MAHFRTYVIAEMINEHSYEINRLLQLAPSLVPFHSNVVIGGTCALGLSGLVLPEIPNDLDLVIFQPTDEQITRLLKDYEYATVHGDSYDTTKDDLPTAASFDDLASVNKKSEEKNLPRSYKLKGNKTVLNVLLAFNDKVPSDTLYYFHSLGFGCGSMPPIKINPVQNVIGAKASYRDKTGQFCRNKDVVYLQQLKSLNFNF